VEVIDSIKDDLAVLRKDSETWYKGKVPLYDYLLSLKAKPGDKIGKFSRSYAFWECIPKEKRPVEGDTYDKLYALRDDLKAEISSYNLETTRVEIRRLNNDLTNFEYDVRIIDDGHYDTALASFIHESWVADEMKASFVRTDTRVIPSAQPRWGDLSSGEEDEVFSATVRSLTRAKESRDPGVDLPKDFDQCFPSLGRRIDKLCNHYGWEKRYDSSIELKKQGLVLFTEEVDGTIKCSLENNERLALLSLYSCVGAMFLKPQALAQEDGTEVALTYVCSVIAREKLAEDRDKDLLKIALKNGDGGKSIFTNRLHFLTKAGSSGIRMVIESLEKLVSKFARELKEDQLDSTTVKAITDRAFTSIDGMLGNCYRRSKVPVYENRAVAGKKGKFPVKVGEKTVVSPPDLSTSRLPLKPSELTKGNSLRTQFNNRKAIVETRIGNVASPTIFTAPMMCKEVVAEAYQKLMPYKTILKSRVAKIREVATEDNNGAKPGPGNWATATTKVIQVTEDINEEVFNYLVWEETMSEN